MASSPLTSALSTRCEARRLAAVDECRADDDAGIGTEATDVGEEVEPVAVGKLAIEDDPGQVRPEEEPSVDQRPGLSHDKALQLEREMHHRADAIVVVDDQERRLGHVLRHPRKLGRQCRLG